MPAICSANLVIKELIIAMLTIKHPLRLLLTATLLFMVAIIQLDQLFFRRASRFSPRFLISSMPYNPQWDLPALSEEEQHLLDELCSQKFHYLNKGTRCFAFLSEDRQYVIKFHRYPSHLRLFPWLNRPLAYQISPKRKQIKEYNIKRILGNFSSYKNSITDLKEENGLLLVHINKTQEIKRHICLIDKSGATHHVPLDQVTFIVQKCARPIYPTLQSLYSAGKLQQAKAIIDQLFTLIDTSCRKGYINEDPVLRTNYGLIDGRAIHIDIGDLMQQDTIKQPQARLAYMEKITLPLKRYLEHNAPELVQAYEDTLQAYRQSIL